MLWYSNVHAGKLLHPRVISEMNEIVGVLERWVASASLSEVVAVAESYSLVLLLEVMRESSHAVCVVDVTSSASPRRLQVLSEHVICDQWGAIVIVIVSGIKEARIK